MQEHGEWFDWTRAEDGRSNSSLAFQALCDEVERLIRGDAHVLIGGRADQTARMVMAHLAHEHHLSPPMIGGIEFHLSSPMIGGN